MSQLFDKDQGIVLYSSRRFCTIYDPKEKVYFSGKTKSRDLDLCPGDIVNFHEEDSSINDSTIISSIVNRKNLLKRSYGNKTKSLTANVSEIWIVTAPPPLFNTLSIDRILTASAIEGITCRIIANKSDLNQFPQFKSELLSYKSMGIEICETSALNGSGINSLEKFLSNTKGYTNITLTGISGVGKSSLIRKLFPFTQTHSQEVSMKTGQGKQTTSSARGYVIASSTEETKIIIDLPGIQKFGVSHLKIEEVQEEMQDINKLSKNCKFRNCTHRKEPNCAVRNGLDTGELSESRYHSYLDMLKELELESKKY